MVRLNGLAIEDFAPILRETIEIDTPKIIDKWEDKAISHGAHFVRTKYGLRKIKVNLYLLIVSPEQRADYVNAVCRWANYTEPKVLELPNKPGRYINALVSSLPSASTREWWEKLSIEFTAGDPFFYDTDYRTAPCGVPFEIGGDGPASAYIQRISATSVTDPSWELDGDKTIELDGTFDAGTMKADLDLKKVYLDDVSQMQYLTLQSRFFDLDPGVHTIVGSGTVFYKQRWL